MEETKEIQKENNEVNQPAKKKNRGRYSLPKDNTQRMTGKKEPYLEPLKDKMFGELAILNTANAWWIDRIKIVKLFDAYKIDCNDDEACAYVGITLAQLQYFKKLHPDFYRVKSACGQNLGLIAKKNFAIGVEKDKGMSLEYLKMKRKDEGYTNRTEQTGANGRDLYDRLTQEIKQLGEELRSNKYGDSDENKKHIDQPSSGDADAGSVRSGNETAASENASAGQDVPAKDGEAV